MASSAAILLSSVAMPESLNHRLMRLVPFRDPDTDAIKFRGVHCRDECDARTKLAGPVIYHLQRETDGLKLRGLDDTHPMTAYEETLQLPVDLPEYPQLSIGHIIRDPARDEAIAARAATRCYYCMPCFDTRAGDLEDWRPRQDLPDTFEQPTAEWVATVSGPTGRYCDLVFPQNLNMSRRPDWVDPTNMACKLAPDVDCEDEEHPCYELLPIDNGCNQEPVAENAWHLMEAWHSELAAVYFDSDCPEQGFTQSLSMLNMLCVSTYCRKLTLEDGSCEYRGLLLIHFRLSYTETYAPACADCCAVLVQFPELPGVEDYFGCYEIGLDEMCFPRGSYLVPPHVPPGGATPCSLTVTIGGS